MARVVFFHFTFKVNSKENDFIRREETIKKIEVKQEEQMSLHMQNIQESSTKLDAQSMELQRVQAEIENKKQMIVTIEKQHNTTIQAENAKNEEMSKCLT